MRFVCLSVGWGKSVLRSFVCWGGDAFEIIYRSRRVVVNECVL